jgi:AcrR family transcriptional regulator
MPPKAALRARILEAARRMFFARGFFRVSMDALAAELGVSKKTLYNHFSGKEAILQAITRGMMREISERVDALTADRTMDFVEKLRTLMAFIGSRVAQMTRPFAEDLHRHAPHLWKEIEEFRSRKILDNFSRLFQEGMDQGVFRRDIHPRVLVMTYYHAIQNVVTPEFFAQVPLSAQEVFDGVLKVIFEGILTEPVRRRSAAPFSRASIARTNPAPHPHARRSP